MVRAKAGVHIKNACEASKKQSRAGQQHQAQGHLRHHQDLPGDRAARASSGGRSALEGVGRVDLC